MIKLALLGFGTVGQGVYRIWEENPHLQERFEIAAILVRDEKKKRETEIAPERLTADIDAVFSSTGIDAFIELTGEVDGIQDRVRTALERGQHVITANKALVSHALETLEAAAAEGGAALRYEAAVAGAVPVVKAVRDMARVRPVTEIRGILNGTCNFILSRMAKGDDYQDALEEAQRLGFAEADPTADVEGHDTKRKLRILATLGFNATITEDDIPCKGISGLAARDLALLQRHGRTVKLIGIAKRKDRRFTAHVLPVCVPADDPFAKVEGSYNQIRVDADYPHVLNWNGPGAGMYPTAHAVWNDILDTFETTPVAAPVRDSAVCTNDTSEDYYYIRSEKPIEKLFPDLPFQSLEEARIVGPVRAEVWKTVTDQIPDAHWALWIHE